MTNNKVQQWLLAVLSCCVLTLWAPPAAGADYVDAVNSNAKGTDGQRVVYELNVGMFTSEGTLRAAQARLSELKTLGVDVVWLMPIYPRGTSGSPYAATDFKAVNPKYGTVADLKDFVAAAHALDMQVWLDWVPNHTATNATWVTTHPEYYTTSGGQMVHPNNYQDVWQLNYNNAGLTDAMNSCLKFWIDEADVDGYRCDYISSQAIPTSYWQTAIPLIKGYKSGKTITFLGEADIATDAVRLKNAGFDYDYAWQFQSQLANFGSSGNAAARPKAFVNTLLDNQNGISFGRMLYLTNHDQNFNDGGKTLTQYYGNNRYPLTVLTFTVWGMPLIYNGQEVGGNQILDYFSDTKINWNGADEKMLNTIRTLTALKHAVPAFRDGKTTATSHTVNWLTVTNNTAVLAYTCKYGDSEALVLLNFGTSAGSAVVTGLSAGQYGLWLDSETISQGVSRKQVSLNATHAFTLEAKGYQVYVKGTFSEEELPEVEVYTPTLDSADEMALFFETAEKADYRVWAWGGNLTEQQHLGITGDWSSRPAMTLMGTTDNGHYVYKFVFQGSEPPTNFIITKNGDTPRPYDGADYVVNGYYVEGTQTPTQIISAVTGVKALRTSGSAAGAVYTLSGQKVTTDGRLPRGIYVRNGQKFIVKQ